ncbi:hypothetical protein CC86DRAFT_377045 [Ophiobolus disseminans]|uniref:Uncharacterized protein n=1 Tax=Ophiobolus disseminans TaxID=1469910 RepID=A0A6A7AM31_9PLEO|nr:hypothetical protein CC86DRAFT_377045 [Ophiobolus disseminans]
MFAHRSSQSRIARYALPQVPLSANCCSTRGFAIYYDDVERRHDAPGQARLTLSPAAALTPSSSPRTAHATPIADPCEHENSLCDRGLRHGPCYLSSALGHSLAPEVSADDRRACQFPSRCMDDLRSSSLIQLPPYRSLNTIPQHNLHRVSRGPTHSLFQSREICETGAWRTSELRLMLSASSRPPDRFASLNTLGARVGNTIGSDLQMHSARPICPLER